MSKSDSYVLQFEVDKQRYGAYFENDKTASAFTAAIAEGIQEVSL